MRFATGFDKVLISRLPILASLHSKRQKEKVPVRSTRSQHMHDLENEGNTISDLQISHIQKQTK